MEPERIKVLLDKYYEGKTSMEEETQLAGFFMNPGVPSEMEADRLLFISLLESSKVTIPDEKFDEKLFAAIESQEKGKVRESNINRFIIPLAGIAAGLLILIGSYFLLVERQAQDSFPAYHSQAIDDPQLAYEEARGALLAVSQVMNKGTRELEALSRMEDATRNLAMINKFEQGAGELSVISRFDEAVTGIRGIMPITGP
jgi:hypothetical protein